jgi:polysaccharide biosynthesis/export protein
MMHTQTRRALWVGVALFVGVLNLAAQGKEVAKEQIKDEAETQLRQMTAEEVERVIKEYGMTVEEATKRAQSFGISLQEYLTRRSAAKNQPTQSILFDPRLSWQLVAPSLPGADSTNGQKSGKEPPRLVAVPGFHGRRAIDSTLQPFGYSLFELSSATFTPSVTVATPPSYVLGVGDEVMVNVWGETQLQYSLQVNREGNLYVPEVGPVLAQGLTIQHFRERLLHRMASVYSSLNGHKGNRGAYLDVSLGKLKTIQVLVLGEVRKPGGYAITSMSTVLHALYLAGGPTMEGTMRDVQIVRKGETIKGIDLYGYILQADRSSDIPLLDGDIVFVRPVGRRAAITGHVLRPAIYELREGEQLGTLVKLAGGLRFDAYADRIHIERVVPFDRRHEFDHDILDFDVKFAQVSDLLSSTTPLENGDILKVYGLAQRFQNRVIVAGSVNKPGPFELVPGMRIADIIRAADSLKLSTFAERGTIFRTLQNLRIEVLGFNPRLALEGVASENFLLQNEDSVVIYADDQFHPRHSVRLFGAVRSPGEYARYEHMKMADLVVMAGGLAPGASLTAWELSRLDTTELGTYTHVEKIDSPKDYWGGTTDTSAVLQDYDVLFVPFDPRFSSQKFVRISGYVMFPGVYSIRYEGERIADIFKRAGGLRPGAYLEGSRLIRRFNKSGLVPLDFRQAIEKPESRDNVVVYDGDSVHVAMTEDVVYVSGEVYVPSPVLFEEGEGLDYYIEQAGGYKKEAEEKNTVVFLPGGKKWESGDILPGSTILVPRKIETPDDTLPIIRDLATILASLAAITVALIQVSK